MVHPLDDVPEDKGGYRGAGPHADDRSVRLSLLSLRAYLILMVLLVVYHVLDLAGLFGHRG